MRVRRRRATFRYGTILRSNGSLALVAVGERVFCVAGLQTTFSRQDLHTFGAAAYPALGGSFPAQYFLFPLDYIAAQSGGFSTSRVGLGSIPAAFGNYSLSVPEAGWYMVTMQCAYYDIEFASKPSLTARSITGCTEILVELLVD
jgi:hypothetical protein